MSTFFLQYLAAFDTEEKWTAQVATIQSQAVDNSASEFRLDGCTIGIMYYGRDLEWRYQTNGMATETPVALALWLARNPGWSIVSVEITKGAGVVDHRSAYQGEYEDDDKFPNCFATVDNLTSDRMGPHQCITVRGPAPFIGDYFSAIRMRKLHPKRWYEPKPWWWRLRHPLGG